MEANSLHPFDNRVPKLAREISWHRKLDSLRHPERLDAIPSTVEETASDWRSAVAYCLREALTATRSFSAYDESWLEGFSLAWLDDVKHLMAYSIWRSRWEEDGVWTHAGHRTDHYNRGCEEIHRWLVDKKVKQDKQQFAQAKNYIRTRYFGKGGTLQFGKPEVENLVKRKAARIWEITHRSDDLLNWKIAKQFVESFYSNVIPAVEYENTASIDATLRAIQDCGGSDRCSVLVNGFEAALAVCFLDVEAITAFEKKDGLVF